MKIYNKRELQNIAIDHSADLLQSLFKDLQKLYKRTLFFFDY